MKGSIRCISTLNCSVTQELIIHKLSHRSMCIFRSWQIFALSERQICNPSISFKPISPEPVSWFNLVLVSKPHKNRTPSHLKKRLWGRLFLRYRGHWEMDKTQLGYRKKGNEREFQNTYPAIYWPKTTDVIPSGRAESFITFSRTNQLREGERKWECERARKRNAGAAKKEKVQISLREKFHQIQLLSLRLQAISFILQN